VSHSSRLEPKGEALDAEDEAGNETGDRIIENFHGRKELWHIATDGYRVRPQHALELMTVMSE
jgi:hypothetical protein